MLCRSDGCVVRQSYEARSHEFADSEAVTAGGWVVRSDGIGQAAVVHDRQGTTGNACASVG